MQTNLPLFSNRLEQLMYAKPFNPHAFYAGQRLGRARRGGQQKVGHIEPLFNFNLPTIILCLKHPIGFKS